MNRKDFTSVTSSSNESIFNLAFRCLPLLTGEQRRKLIWFVSGAIVIGVLDVVSITSVLPVIQELLSLTSSDSDIFVSAALPKYSLYVIVVALFSIKNILAIVLSRQLFQFLDGIYISLSRQRYIQYYNQDWLSTRSQNSADNASKIKVTPYDFTNHVINGFLLLATDVVVCSLMIVVLTIVDTRIILILSALALPVIGFYVFLRKNVAGKVDRSFRELTPRGNIILNEGINSFSESRLYNKELFFINKFIDIAKLTTNQLSRLKLFSYLPARLFETFAVILILVATVYIEVYFAGDKRWVYFLGVLSLALFRIIPAASRIIISLGEIKAFSYSVSELERSSNLTLPARTDATDQHIMFRSRLQIQNLSYTYPGNPKPVFSTINFTINKGDFIVIIGTSGSGKTTLLNILCGLLTGYTGHVIVDERVLSEELVTGWQQNLGLVQQEPNILQDTITRNVAFGQHDEFIDHTRVKTSLEMAALKHFVESLPLGESTMVGENGMTLSGGQRQRLQLATALYRNPQLLLIDEGTNQLDEQSKLLVLNNLKVLTRSGTTVIVASHDPIVKAYADKILQIN